MVIISVTGGDHDGLAPRYSYSNLTGPFNPLARPDYYRYRPAAGTPEDFLLDSLVISDAKPRAAVLGHPQTSILTLRAKKSDVDAFGKGGLSYEEFGKRVESYLVDTPRAASLVEAPAEVSGMHWTLGLGIDRSGQFHIGGVPLDDVTCLEQIREAKKKDYAIVIEADEGTPHKRVVDMIDLCEKAGVTDVKVSIRKGQADAPPVF